MQKDRMGCTRQHTQTCKPLPILEQIFQLAGLGHELGAVMGSWFQYEAALPNLVNTAGA